MVFCEKVDEQMKRFKNVYFINGTAYAGKSTMVKMLAEKYNGIACEENYQDVKLSDLDSREFPGLTYTRDLKDWREFIRRTPDEYEEWIKIVTKECTILEMQIIEELSKYDKPVFVDTNIPVESLMEIADKNHVLIMLAEPEISVNRFFERPDKEKQIITSMKFPFAPKQKYIDVYNKTNDEDKLMYDITNQDGIVWINHIDVGNTVYVKRGV